MAARKKNPVHSSGKKFSYKKVQGQRVPRQPLRTKRERKEFSRTANYMERVEKMRPYFRDVFTPSAGYDLHKIDQWTPAQKKKVTDYFRIVAPRIEGGELVVKRYRRPDHMERAIDASLQEKRLKGQTAALFNIDPGQELEIRFTRKHAPVVRRGGIIEDEIRFDKRAFLDDWKAEVDRALDQTDAKLFKIITGANRSETTFTRSRLIEEIALLIEAYSEENLDPKSFDAKWFGEWLNGIIAYKGVTMPKMKKISADHKAQAQTRRRQHNKDRAKRRRLYKRKRL